MIDWALVLPVVYYIVVAIVAGAFLLMIDDKSRIVRVVVLALFWPLTLLIGLPVVGCMRAFQILSRFIRDMRDGRSYDVNNRLTAIEKDIREMKAMTAWLARRAEQGR